MIDQYQRKCVRAPFSNPFDTHSALGYRPPAPEAMPMVPVMLPSNQLSSYPRSNAPRHQICLIPPQRHDDDNFCYGAFLYRTVRNSFLLVAFVFLA